MHNKVRNNKNDTNKTSIAKKHKEMVQQNYNTILNIFKFNLTKVFI